MLVSARSALVVLVLLVGATWPAARAECQASDGDALARSIFQQGREAFERGELENALRLFERAYAMSPRPLLLFNIATVHDRLRHDDEAIRTFTEFLAAAPNDANAQFARARLASLQQARSRGGPGPATVAVQATTTAPPSVTATATTSSDTGGDPVPGIALIAVGGALLASVIGTTVWWVNRDDSIQQCNLLGCTNGPSLVGERDAATGLTFALGVVGIASLGTGIALLVSAGGSGGSAELVCAPGLASLNCAGRF